MPVTLDSRRLEVDKLIAEARALRARALEARKRRDAEACAAALDEALLLEAVAERLRGGAQVGTLGTQMDTAQVRSRGAAVSAARTNTRTRTPFQRCLHERGHSLPEWVATQKGLDVEQAKSWVKRKGHGGRAIPRAWADKLAKEFEEPALAHPDSWPSGIRE